MPSLKKEPPGALAARTIPSLVARGFPPTRACSGYRVAPTRAIRIAVLPGSRSEAPAAWRSSPPSAARCPDALLLAAGKLSKVTTDLFQCL